MLGTTDDLYLEWLYGKVAAVSNKNPNRSWWWLCRRLYSTEFIWLVANDDNRAMDGQVLREEFISEHKDLKLDEDWILMGCSVLEMLIAIAMRAEYISTDILLGDWFKSFMINLGLDKFNDASFKGSDNRKVDEIIERFIFRNYAPDGTGGLFPLKDPPADQRKVELWYQLNGYILENGLI
jgi:hypothetical protein